MKIKKTHTIRITHDDLFNFNIEIDNEHNEISIGSDCDNVFNIPFSVFNVMIENYDSLSNKNKQ